jgi:enoyl-CoA hydratase/carnithine racemase
MTNAVTIEINQGVADVRLNRPEKRNAIDSDVMTGLLSAIEQIKTNKKVRVVVLS